VWVFVCAALLAAFNGDAGEATPDKAGGAQSRFEAMADTKAIGNFVTALAEDAAGRVWIGSEDTGVFCYDPSRPADSNLHVFDPASGLIDTHIYALACDKQGRIWAGHGSAGVSVYANGIWKNYSKIAGPLGSHVYRIKVSPFDGSVWMATSAGLTRYDTNADTWRQFTRQQGLPSNEFGSLDIDAQGHVLAGTLCEGLAYATPQDDYKTWSAFRSAEELSFDSIGKGLPSNQINDVLLAGNGAWFAATPNGLAMSPDRGATWTHWRGKNFAKKIRENYHRDLAVLDSVLAEDWITCLAEAPENQVWVGYHLKGLEIFNPATGKAKPEIAPTALDNDYDFLYCLCASRDAAGKPATLVHTGWYGKGFLEWDYDTGIDMALNAARTPPPEKPGVVKHPTPIPPPTEAELRTLVENWVSEKPAAPRNEATPPTAFVLEDDWQTRGDWLGRHGTYWAELSAFAQSDTYDFYWGAGAATAKMDVWPNIGPKHDKGNATRYYCHALLTDNSGALEIPRPFLERLAKDNPAYLNKPRRESEWNDNGYDRSMELDGPDLHVGFSVPAGRSIVSFYFHNKDSHKGKNRTRDFVLRLYGESKPPGDFLPGDELAQTRVRDFWHGVYKRFVVEGPARYTLVIKRNFTHCVVLSGVFVDDITCKPEPYFGTRNELSILGKSIPAARLIQDPDVGELAARCATVERFMAPRENAPAKDDPLAELYAQACLFDSNYPEMERVLARTQGVTARQAELGLKQPSFYRVISGNDRRYVLDYLKTLVK
jgi:hypothetical protein